MSEAGRRDISLPEIDEGAPKDRSARRSGPISRNRIESLSDLIFGLTLSIGALVLISQPAASPDQMISRIIAFCFNFVIIIEVWIMYTVIVSRLPVERGRVIVANFVLLLLIILMTYLINGITFKSPPLPIPAGTPLSIFSSQLYALDLAGVTLILSFFSHSLSLEKKHLLPLEYLHHARVARNVLFAFGILFLVTALPQMWDWMIASEVPLRFLLWFVPLFGTIWLDAMFFRTPKGRDDPKEAPIAPNFQA